MLAERNSKGGRQSRFCLKVEMVQKQSIWHYQPLKSCTFLRVIVATPNLVTQARSAHLSHMRQCRYVLSMERDACLVMQDKVYLIAWLFHTM